MPPSMASVRPSPRDASRSTADEPCSGGAHALAKIPTSTARPPIVSADEQAAGAELVATAWNGRPGKFCHKQASTWSAWTGLALPRPQRLAPALRTAGTAGIPLSVVVHGVGVYPLAGRPGRPPGTGAPGRWPGAAAAVPAGQSLPRRTRPPGTLGAQRSSNCNGWIGWLA